MAVGLGQRAQTGTNKNIRTALLKGGGQRRYNRIGEGAAVGPLIVKFF